MKVWVVYIDDGKWALAEIENKGYADKERCGIYVGGKYLWGMVFFDKVEAEIYYKEWMDEMEGFRSRALCACGRKPEVLLNTFLLCGTEPAPLNDSVVIRCKECGEVVWVCSQIGYPGDMEGGLRKLMEEALETWSVKNIHRYDDSDRTLEQRVIGLEGQVKRLRGELDGMAKEMKTYLR